MKTIPGFDAKPFGFRSSEMHLTQNPQWKRSINPNRLIHIHLWPRHHVADPALAESVLKDISLGCARKFHTLVFICPKGKFKGVNQTINILMRNLGLMDRHIDSLFF